MSNDPEESRLMTKARALLRQRPIRTPTEETPPRRMPFAWFWPMLAGAGAALVLRIVFSGGPGHRFSAMLGSFVYFVPAVCGAVTVYMAERIERRSWGYYLWAPWVATALFVIGTLAGVHRGDHLRHRHRAAVRGDGQRGRPGDGHRVPHHQLAQARRSTASRCCRSCSAPSSRTCPTPTGSPTPRARSSSRRRPSACGTR
jgi:hypothetical protein